MGPGLGWDDRLVESRQVGLTEKQRTSSKTEKKATARFSLRAVDRYEQMANGSG
jgi:hypothetical protein